MRTVWIAGLCLVAVGGLFATKVASASKTDEMPADTTSALSGGRGSHHDTLTYADRGAAAAADADETVAIPLRSASVRPAAAPHQRAAAPAMTTKRTAAARKVMVAQPKKAAQTRPGPDPKLATACQQRDPIARLLASVHLGQRCAG